MKLCHNTDALLDAYSCNQEEALDQMPALQKKETIKRLPLESTALEAHEIRRRKKRLKLLSFGRKVHVGPVKQPYELDPD